MADESGYDLEFVNEFYDHIVPYRERPDIQFFVEEAVVSKGAVLELGSGTGRVLIPTARAGVEITGVDTSEGMLKRCRARIEQESPEVQSRITLLQGDMRTFRVDRKFALITLPFRPFQHLLTVADQVACLTRIREHLLPGGKIILDVFNPMLEILTSEGPQVVAAAEPEFTMPDGRRIVRSSRIAAVDRFRQVNDGELIYDVTYPDGRFERFVHSFHMRYLFRYEAEHLLARCGFELVDVYSDYSRAPFGSKYPGELICVAKVPGPEK